MMRGSSTAIAPPFFLGDFIRDEVFISRAMLQDFMQSAMRKGQSSSPASVTDSREMTG